MNHDASLPAPPGRTRRIVFPGLAIVALASGAFAVRGPLMMSAPRCMAGRWHGCFDTFNGVVLMTSVGLPSAALVVWALARRRRLVGVARSPRHGPDSRHPVGTVPELGWRSDMAS
ncbi:hypothetical protein [Streptomyces sp. NPDC055400]